MRIRSKFYSNIGYRDNWNGKYALPSYVSKVRRRFRSVKMSRRPLRDKKVREFFLRGCIDARRPTTRKMCDRMFSSNRVFASVRFECRRCRGATCTQGLTGLRLGPLAMPSRSHEARGRRGGSGFEFFPSQYRS